jgi:hypothetical protein
MSDDLIRYDLIVQEALRSAVRKVLADVARDGLPGDHHFFITFRTAAPGVQLSARMRREYPDEMTIVLQHQFWDMSVDDTHFEVGLSFRNVPEKLSIPFDALTGFADPSVQFALRFETDVETASGSAAPDSAGASPAGKPAMLAVPADTSDPAFLAAQRELVKSVEENKSAGDAAPSRDGKPPADRKQDAKPAVARSKSGDDDDKPEEADDGADSKVISIDAFRKKT